VLDDDVKALLGRGEEKEAATAALRAHGPEILGYLENVLGDHDDARDVFQRFAEDLWTWLPAYRGGSLRAAGPAHRLANIRLATIGATTGWDGARNGMRRRSSTLFRVPTRHSGGPRLHNWQLGIA
jgi:hypothetical protein